MLSNVHKTTAGKVGPVAVDFLCMIEPFVEYVRGTVLDDETRTFFRRKLREERTQSEVETLTPNRRADKEKVKKLIGRQGVGGAFGTEYCRGHAVGNHPDHALGNARRGRLLPYPMRMDPEAIAFACDFPGPRREGMDRNPRSEQQ